MFTPVRQTFDILYIKKDNDWVHNLLIKPFSSIFFQEMINWTKILYLLSEPVSLFYTWENWGSQSVGYFSR